MIGPAEIEEMMAEHAEAVAKADSDAIAKALAWSADRPVSYAKPLPAPKRLSSSYWPQFGFGSFSN